MAANGSSQCGFCTPGIVMTLTGLLWKRIPIRTRKRSTTRLPAICAAAPDTARSSRPRRRRRKAGIGKPAAPELPARQATVSCNGSVLHQPATLDELTALRAEFPKAVILAGGTDLGVARADYHSEWDRIISTARVRELRAIEETPDAWTFGAAVTWDEILRTIREAYPSLATLIRRFGSTQIRAMGTVGGNIGTASPIGDGPPSLIALGADITLASKAGGLRAIKLEDFFLDYRKTELQPDEVIASVTVPRPKTGEAFRVYKLSKRYDQDISTVCGAFWIAAENGEVSACRLAYGGMAAIPKRAKESENRLLGRELDSVSISDAVDSLAADFAPLTDWRGSAAYRARTAGSLLQRFARDLAGETVEVMAL